MCIDLGSKANYCLCDVSKEADCKFLEKLSFRNKYIRNMINECIKVYSEIDILVCPLNYQGFN